MISFSLQMLKSIFWMLCPEEKIFTWDVYSDGQSCMVTGKDWAAFRICCEKMMKTSQKLQDRYPQHNYIAYS